MIADFRQFVRLHRTALLTIIVLNCVSERSWPHRRCGGWGNKMAERGRPLLLYVDSDPVLRRLANATFRGEYVVESVATVDDVHNVIEPAVALINLSDSLNPRSAWNRLTHRWPTVPAVMLLSTEAVERNRETFWAMEPAAMVINPDSSDAMRRGVAAALS